VYVYLLLPQRSKVVFHSMLFDGEEKCVALAFIPLYATFAFLFGIEGISAFPLFHWQTLTKLAASLTAL
jgi:hypothetical protein